MEITRMYTNHLANPLGYFFGEISLSWTVQGTAAKRQAAARVEIAADEAFTALLHDSGRREDLCSLGYRPDLALSPATRYYWRVTVWADDGGTASGEAWFETAKQDTALKAQWITAPFAETVHPYFRRSFALPAPVKQARAYVCGLGVYELYVNGEKAGDEFLTPYYNDYHEWLQYQTFDVTGLLHEGENAVGAWLGNGWYKGRFGFSEQHESALFGNRFVLLCELSVTLETGETFTLGTGTDWQCAPSPVLESSIYDGEVYDANLEIEGWSAPGLAQDARWQSAAPAAAPSGKLMARLSPPVTVHETLGPPTLLHTPKGETVLDFGQNMTGWFTFSCDLPKGARVRVQCGEILQDDCFYNDNLRSAKEEYVFFSAGRKAQVRPHFTFYGFRYLKVEGLGDEFDPALFQGLVLHSDMAQTGWIETSDPKLNQLFHNALWGQKGNFLDVPTDCPQRDERMGWTGDAQIFCATACYNMYTPAFYRKYLYDMLLEQRRHGGSVPHVVPDILSLDALEDHSLSMGEHGSCAWGDAATVIPWTLYQMFGDKALLEATFENMCGWVRYMIEQDKAGGDTRLWHTGFHFADWLALDNPDHESRFGATDCYYVASVYYYYSVRLTEKAARVLGRDDLAEAYAARAEEIRGAIRKEYFTETGRIACDTQTGMVLALYFDLVPPQHRARLIGDLKQKLDSSNRHLTTGFVGTPYLCPTLSQAGANDYAYTLLFNEDFPSWLYEVNMGATTVWERWNSVLPDGYMSDTGMNSLNHYAYGSIVEWMYRYMCGLSPSENAPGFREAVIAPQPDPRLAWAKARYDAAAGTYESGWRHTEDGITFAFTIPFHARARFVLPQGLSVKAFTCGGQALAYDPAALLPAGQYTLAAAK